MFDPDDLDDETAAYHEAGHALVAHLLGGEVVQCTIEDEDGDLHGSTTVRWRVVDPVERARRIGLSALGGPLAEARFRGDMDVIESLTAWEDDWRQAQQALAAAGAAPTQQKQLLGRWVREVAGWFTDEDTWERLCRVADALAAHGTLDGELFVDAADGRAAARRGQPSDAPMSSGRRAVKSASPAAVRQAVLQHAARTVPVAVAAGVAGGVLAKWLTAAVAVVALVVGFAAWPPATTTPLAVDRAGESAPARARRPSSPTSAPKRPLTKSARGRPRRPPARRSRRQRPPANCACACCDRTGRR